MPPKEICFDPDLQPVQKRRYYSVAWLDRTSSGRMCCRRRHHQTLMLLVRLACPTVTGCFLGLMNHQMYSMLLVCQRWMCSLSQVVMPDQKMMSGRKWTSLRRPEQLHCSCLRTGSTPVQWRYCSLRQMGSKLRVRGLPLTQQPLACPTVISVHQQQSGRDMVVAVEWRHCRPPTI